MGVVLKRAVYFVTCGGRMYYPVRLEEDAIVRNLLATEKRDVRLEVPKYHQMSLFDDTMPFADAMFQGGLQQKEGELVI